MPKRPQGCAHVAEDGAALLRGVGRDRESCPGPDAECIAATW